MFVSRRSNTFDLILAPISNPTRTYNLRSAIIFLFLTTLMYSFSSLHSLDIVLHMTIYPLYKPSTAFSLPSWQNSNAGWIWLLSTKIDKRGWRKSCSRVDYLLLNSRPKDAVGLYYCSESLVHYVSTKLGDTFIPSSIFKTLTPFPPSFLSADDLASYFTAKLKADRSEHPQGLHPHHLYLCPGVWTHLGCFPCWCWAGFYPV